MARARNIKPGLYKNEDLAECSIWARFIFPGLWMLADREGRLEDRPKRIKAELLPFDSEDVEPLLVELMESGFIIRYEVNDVRYIQIAKFSDHQTPHVREQASTFPAPPVIGQGITKAVVSTRLGDDMPSPGSPDCGLPLPSSLNPSEDIPPAVPAVLKKTPSKGVRLPADWFLPKAWGEWALAERPDWSAEDVRQCSLRFADFWHAKGGKDAVKLDWLATWRNWVRNDKGAAGRPVGSSAGASIFAGAL